MGLGTEGQGVARTRAPDRGESDSPEDGDGAHRHRLPGSCSQPRQHAPRVPPISVEAQIEGHRFSPRQHPPPIPRSQALSGQLAVLNREGLWAQSPSALDCPPLASVQVLCADQGSRCCFILAIWLLRLKGPLLCVS